jgi:ABC-type nitrate/sulfonate/bicarbonate transport system ATPase subunit
VLRFEAAHRFFHVGGEVVRAMDGVDLEVAGKGIVTVVGSSGSGKTTLIRLAAGLDRPDLGQVWRHEASKLGVVFQEPRLLRSLTVEGNILLGLGAGRAVRRNLGRVHEVMELLGLGEFRRAYPDQLSGGLAQRVALGRALVRDPELLLMDEPFSALDVPLRRRLQDELLAILETRAMSVVFVTHDLAEAIYLGDRVLVMRSGRIVWDGPIELDRPRDLRSASVHRLQDALAQLLGEGGDRPSTPGASQGCGQDERNKEVMA